LYWRPDGLVRADTSKGSISSGIYTFETPEISGTIDLIAFMDSFLGRKTGITPEAQGAGEETEKVGIYFGNLQQVADRLGLYNKSYREAWERLGERYAWGLKEHMTEKMMVKMIGETGVEWDELRRDEVQKAPELEIEISAGSAEIAANEAKAKKRENALMMLLKRPDLSAQLNQQWLIQQILKHGAFEEEEIRMALSKETVNLELMSEASKAIQQILRGKTPKLNRGANTAFIQKIVDYAIDSDVNFEIFKKLMDYANAHIPIAIENISRKIVISKERVPGIEEKKPMIGISENLMVEEPVLGSPSGIKGLSQKATNILQGKSNLEE